MKKTIDSRENETQLNSIFKGTYFPIYLNNPDNLARGFEPIEVPLMFTEDVLEEQLRLFNHKGEAVPFQLYDTDYEEGFLKKGMLVFIDQLCVLTTVYWLTISTESSALQTTGIECLPVTQADGYKRLDTGYYELELCSGKADGTAAGKWGIRGFEAKSEGKNLIKDYSNAIGGFYGPFFTPKNGLINPPEHTRVSCQAEVEGPLYCRYLFEGQIPNGLDNQLKNKQFKITWEFFYNTPIFRRKYEVDSFETIVDGMPIKNKITVGDEFESGQGNIVFNKFASYGQTIYREGDLYATILADSVREILNQPIEEGRTHLQTYKDSIGDNINEVSWDFFWKMFCSEEQLLTDEEIIDHVTQIIPEAHQVTHGGKRHKEVVVSNEVEVNEAPEQTIFPMSANKTCESNDETGYSMVWYTSSVVNRYQIVQRKDSGWVNWGTNGENEYPELENGSTIRTAYGQFPQWETMADAMEKPIVAMQGAIQKGD